MLKLKNLALAGALLASTALPAFALPITITGEDNLGNTDTATAGSPVNFGPAIVGAWTINGSAQGTPPAPQGTLFSNTISFTSDATGPSSFTLWVTENGLTASGVRTFLSTLTSNGLTGGVNGVTLSTFIQSGDTTPGPTVPDGALLANGFFTGLGTDSVTSDGDTGASLFSLTERYDITATGPGGADLTIILAEQAVPEPASLAIFGSALLGMGVVGRLRRRKNGKTDLSGTSAA